MHRIASGPDRRRVRRRVPGETESLSRVRLRIGPELHVVDVSDHGVLVEAAARLLPGARVDLHVVGRHGRVLVRSRVVRAHVCALRADLVRYHAALVFDAPVDTTADG